QRRRLHRLTAARAWASRGGVASLRWREACFPGTSGVARAQLQLHVVRVAEEQRVQLQPDHRAEVLDSAVGYAALVKQGRRALQLLAAVHGERQVVQPDPVLVE